MTPGEIEQGFQSIKDLRLIGRDIKKTIIIDNLKENFESTCPNNGIEIESWYGDDLEDTALRDLIPFLKAIVENEEKDVRKVIKKYNGDYSRYVKEIGSRLKTPGARKKPVVTRQLSLVSNVSNTSSVKAQYRKELD